MPALTTLSIHDMFQLQVDASFAWRQVWDEAIGDVLEEGPDDSSESCPAIRWIHDRVLPAAGMRKLEERIYTSEGAVLDEYYRVRLEAADGYALVIKSDNPSLEWMAWSLQLGALVSGATFVHCAALERNGDAVILPSWGGIGKTALVEEFVRRRGWRLLGDDLAILSADGVCYGFPKALVIYPYHRSTFPELFADGKGPVAPVGVNDLLTKMGVAIKPALRYFPAALQAARRHNPQSRRVRPSAVFGQEKLARHGRLRAAIWIDRVPGLESLRLRSDDGTLASRLMGSTLNEYDARCIKLSNIAMGLGLIRARDFYDAWLRILDQGLMDCRRLLLDCPAKSSLTEMAGAVELALTESGISAG